MTATWEQYFRPVPILQWLVVIVLSVHLLLSGESALGGTNAAIYVLGLLVGNVALLHGLPKLIGVNALAATLVVTDTIVVPVTLYATGTATDFFLVYFAIIMIAGTSGNLKRSLVLAAATGVVYVAFTLMVGGNSAPLETVLLRLPFFLVVTLFYGVLGEFAQRDRRDNEKLAYAATHDELTGLPNRRLVMESLARELEAARRFQAPLSLALMDVDHFKQINDAYGHDMGDRVLRDYSSLLSLQSRGYDVVGRLGGDEYVWILPRVEQTGALMAGERLRGAVERFRFGNGQPVLRVTISIGLTTYMPGVMAHPTPADILKAADVALYEAKKEGRNRVCHLSMQDTVTAPLVASQPAVGDGRAHEPRPDSH